eukprot:CAMPEP_0113397516 /NCGR_PEP_ID=MMETSP0013_2-20120614/14429_1 /TAXON_ID=2843 ORGANISM="Skeletonema costatum, Strain 1716" /NCGR_SAMPLE_ID=MMETSP0013_2 /ASSEMBLY_ACC=CAM_ASM_000158 /LENGTH=443 /DNA_ID=CAMNT_0000282119 /DNA_START=194 /DNA_END=1526 /DNA_ORIENTATION=- /assembly_acc=CAM_ASM_000158
MAIDVFSGEQQPSTTTVATWHFEIIINDNNNMDDITRSIQNDSYLATAVSTTTPNDDDSPQTTANKTQTSPAKEILVDNNGGTAKQWFTYSLPEGYCVGVLSSHNNNINEASSSIEQRLLHPEEYKWGMTNLSAASSRTSYYLGRIALRLALQRLLVPHGDDGDDGDGDDEVVVSSSSRSSMTPSSSASSSSSRLSTIEQQSKSSMQHPPPPSSAAELNQKTLLYNTIATKPIQKDSHGRPILPEMVVGSISHKGECAVGLASFHPLFFDSVGGAEQVVSRSVVVDSSVDSEVQWREDCPIYYNDDDDDSNNRERIGIGVDIEHIDGIRGERIQRKVLTETERSELGGLVEELGISIGEEVMLRFSLKESVYKAMHPILCEYVGFQEAEITPFPDGTAKVVLNLQSGSHERLGIVVRSTSWRRLEGGKFFLTTALVGVNSSSS